MSCEINFGGIRAILASLHLTVVKPEDAYRVVPIRLRVIKCADDEVGICQDYLANSEGFNQELSPYRLENIILRIPGYIEFRFSLGGKHNSVPKFPGASLIISSPRMKEHDLLSECDRFHIRLFL